jgi:uncharacterized protein YjaZ
MLKVIHYQNQAYELPFEPLIAESLVEVRKLLPTIPSNIQIYFSNYGILEDTGVGGYAYSSDIITISLDPDFDDKEKQKASIRPAVFHEAFHLSQKFTGEDGPFSAIDNAIYEGMATIFERENAGVFEQYGDYRQIPEEKLKQWVEELKKLSAEVFADEKVYSKWKFYHPELQERWIAYRTGTWLVDQVLQKQDLTILDLQSSTASDVLNLYNK